MDYLKNCLYSNLLFYYEFQWKTYIQYSTDYKILIFHAFVEIMQNMPMNTNH